MPDFPYRSALIVGAGPGISASVARRLAGFGVKIALAARNIQKLDALIKDTGAQAFAADASSPESVANLFEEVRNRVDEPEIVVYNAAVRAPTSMCCAKRAARGRMRLNCVPGLNTSN